MKKRGGICKFASENGTRRHVLKWQPFQEVKAERYHSIRAEEMTFERMRLGTRCWIEKRTVG